MQQGPNNIRCRLKILNKIDYLKIYTHRLVIVIHGLSLQECYIH